MLKAWRSRGAFLLGALALTTMTLTSMACDGGFADEEATARCDQEMEARSQGQNGSCLTDEAYDECVAAHVECGDDVIIVESCPTGFSCRAD